ncbi:MAG: vitamin B12-dependent ribonucleotide reductase [Patescibacteria group bacterium]|nr:vitamin B12-dependent ribonucleotide reductase [Patescibacteria group bacterium]
MKETATSQPTNFATRLLSKRFKQMPKEIRKRDGQVVPFDHNKIALAIQKAMISVNELNKSLARRLADEAVTILVERLPAGAIPAVEGVQDIVEEILVRSSLFKVAKAYIIYRQKHKEIREARKMLQEYQVKVKSTPNAMVVLQKRYLSKDEQGKITESPEEMFKRVANNIAYADNLYKTLYHQDVNIEDTAKEFYRVMSNFEFLPNSPTLMNAGRDLQQLAGCFVLPVDDDMSSIFEAIKNTALIHQSGGGTGFSFTRLRPKGDIVKSTGGVASGPISFMRVFNAATEAVKQGGTRRGANMGIIRVDHPDIFEFITCKENNQELNNFNISVAVTEEFMKAVEKDRDYELINPRNKLVSKKISASKVFDLMTTMAWKNGDPGIIFIDQMNRHNPTPAIGEIESTNPCGEQPLLPFESCNLGSINLAKIVTDQKEIDWDALRRTVRTATHFLDNVIDMNRFPLSQIEEMVEKNRKIGLGIMGFADLLVQLEVPYNSSEALKLGEKIMQFVNREARTMSEELADVRGAFPSFAQSIYASDKKGKKIRNSTRTTIAPTGTISIIAGCSSGIEPLFAISYVRKNILDSGDTLIEVNPYFERVAKDEGFYSDELMRKIAEKGTIQSFTEIPEKVRKVFVTAHDITPEDHIKMQAAFQKYTDNAVSKTVNFPHNATIDDVEKVYLLAYKLGCKGVTIYRDRSRETQVLNIGAEEKKKEDDSVGTRSIKQEVTLGEMVDKDKCPECGSRLEIKEGCMSCPGCGFSACSIS